MTIENIVIKGQAPHRPGIDPIRGDSGCSGKCRPRTGRGSTRMGGDLAVWLYASPAPPGIDPRPLNLGTSYSRKPRTAGDRPVSAARQTSIPAQAPHRRGSTQPSGLDPVDGDARPAEAGIDPGGHAYPVGIGRMPRRSGDRPWAVPPAPYLPRYAPQERGSTPASFTWCKGMSVRAAGTGIDPDCQSRSSSSCSRPPHRRGSTHGSPRLSRVPAGPAPSGNDWMASNERYTHCLKIRDQPCQTNRPSKEARM